MTRKKKAEKIGKEEGERDGEGEKRQEKRESERTNHLGREEPQPHLRRARPQSGRPGGFARVWPAHPLGWLLARRPRARRSLSRPTRPRAVWWG